MKNIINNCNTPNRRDRVIKGKLYGVKVGAPFKDCNIKHYGYDIDMEIYGIWLEAINICASRSMYMPLDVLDDYLYRNGFDYLFEE